MVCYVNLGKSGLLVSEISLGTMTFGRETPEADSVAMLNLYLEKGGNFIDTANIYAQGKSEEILGRALQGKKRQEVVLATKGFFRMGEGLYDHGANRKHLRRALEESLRRLQTDYVDLYQIHCFDLSTPQEEVLETLQRMVEEGKVLYVGLSNYTGWQIARSVSLAERYGFPRFVSAQMQYSLVERNIELEVMPACRELGLSIMAWGPLGGGFLSGKYQAGEFPNQRGADCQSQRRMGGALEPARHRKEFSDSESCGGTSPKIRKNRAPGGPKLASPERGGYSHSWSDKICPA
jgi:aryl-alcohol dehydrogenase-like predicted oxidoreductase